MAKFFGPIGYAVQTETRPGVWVDKIVEHDSYGEVERPFSSNWSASNESTNDDLNINAQISIVADPFVYDNLRSMKYVRFMGSEWKITKIEPRHPRLILTIGGVYNGQTA